MLLKPYSTAQPDVSARRPARAASVHTNRSPELSADASLHLFAILRRMASRERPYADSAFFADRAEFETRRISLATLARPCPIVSPAENRSRESPSTNLRRSPNDRRAPLDRSSAVHRDQTPSVCSPNRRLKSSTAC